MGYVGNTPALNYTTFATQHFTTSATTSYSLDNAVTNENGIALFINNVRQEPGSSYAYTASGTTLTLSAATTTSDTMYCVFIGKAVQTVNPGAGSVGLSQLSATGTASSSTFLRGDNSWTDPGGVALATSTDNQVVTVTGADAITGETNLTYDGTILGVGATGAAADLGVGLHIRTADSGASVHAEADELVLEGTANTGLSILNNATGLGSILFADPSDTNIGYMTYNHNTDAMVFGTNDATRLEITSDGRGLSQFTARAWINFNGSGTAAINDSHNVSSLTDNSSGDFTINFSNDMPNDTYCLAGGGGDVDDHVAWRNYNGGGHAVGSANIGVQTSASAYADRNGTCAVFFGG